MSEESAEVSIAVLKTEMKALITEVQSLRRDVDNLKLWRQWTIGVSFVFVLIWTTFLPEMKDAISGKQ